MKNCREYIDEIELEETINEKGKRKLYFNIKYSQFVKLLEQVQKEAWNEALDKAAESADVTDLGIEGNAVVDLNSILKLKL